MTERIVESITKINKATPVMVCIDGVDGSGKTYFAKSLTQKINSSGKTVALCSVDNFHYPKNIRYQKGKESAIGFYKDSYDYPSLISNLLEPFKKGEGNYIESIFDVDRNAPIESAPKPVPKNSILIVEGIFLQRPELSNFCDLKIFLDVDFQITLSRNINRAKDINRIGLKEEIEARYMKRYMPGQKIYFDQAKPKENADIVIDNSDYKNPIIIKNKST